MDMEINLAGEEVVIAAGNDEAGTEMNANTEAGSEVNDYTSIKLNEINSKGDPFDWIEFFNLSDQEIDLQGCMLSIKRRSQTNISSLME